MEARNQHAGMFARDGLRERAPRLRSLCPLSVHRLPQPAAGGESNGCHGRNLDLLSGAWIMAIPSAPSRRSKRAEAHDLYDIATGHRVGDHFFERVQPSHDLR